MRKFISGLCDLIIPVSLVGLMIAVNTVTNNKESSIISVLFLLVFFTSLIYLISYYLDMLRKFWKRH